MADTSGLNDVIIIKKYANRRLYDTSSSSYVTLEHLSTLVREGKDFVVQDAKTGEDLTRSVLAQIIFEQENKGGNALPLNFLRQVIRFYGDSMQTMVPSYLEHSMSLFTREQEKIRAQMSETFGPKAFMALDEQVRNNMQMFTEAMKVFTPFSPKNSTSSENGGESGDTDIDTLKAQMAEMQAKLNDLAKKD